MNKNSISKDYEKAVKHYAKDRKNYLLHNVGKDKSLLILDNLFKNTNYSISIAMQSFSDEIVNSDICVEGIREFLNKEDTTIKIIIAEDQLGPESLIKFPFYKMLRNHPGRKLSERVTIKSGVRIERNGDVPISFYVGDTRMYYLEFDTSEHRFIANYNDEEVALKLTDKIYSVLSLNPGKYENNIK